MHGAVSGSVLQGCLCWLDDGMSQRVADASRGAVSQPQLNQRSAMLVCTWRKAPYGV